MVQYHESPEELRRMQQRRAIRLNLQKEFNRVYYNPYRYVEHVELNDPAVSRYTAMRASIYEHWKPNWRSFWKWSLFSWIPIFALGIRLRYYFADYEAKVRRGEIPYEKRDFRRI